MTKNIQIKKAELSTKGKNHSNTYNQDSYRTLDEKIFVIADGHGKKGEELSRIATNVMSTNLQNLINAKNRRHLNNEDIMKAIYDSVNFANNAVYDFKESELESISQEETMFQITKGAGTTLSAAMLSDGKLYVASVGDSRIYALYDSKKLVQLTKDDTLKQQLIDSRRIKPEMEYIPDRKKDDLLIKLGTKKDIEIKDVEIKEYNIDGLRTIALLVDGITKNVTSAEIQNILYEYKEPMSAIKQLVDRANSPQGVRKIRQDFFEKNQKYVMKLFRTDDIEMVRQAFVEEFGGRDDITGIVVRLYDEDKMIESKETDINTIREKDITQTEPYQDPKATLSIADLVIKEKDDELVAKDAELRETYERISSLEKGIKEYQEQIKRNDAVRSGLGALVDVQAKGCYTSRLKQLKGHFKTDAAKTTLDILAGHHDGARVHRWKDRIKHLKDLYSGDVCMDNQEKENILEALEQNRYLKQKHPEIYNSISRIINSKDIYGDAGVMLENLHKEKDQLTIEKADLESLIKIGAQEAVRDYLKSDDLGASVRRVVQDSLPELSETFKDKIRQAYDQQRKEDAGRHAESMEKIKKQYEAQLKQRKEQELKLRVELNDYFNQNAGLLKKNDKLEERLSKSNGRYLEIKNDYQELEKKYKKLSKTLDRAGSGQESLSLSQRIRRWVMPVMAAGAIFALGLFGGAYHPNRINHNPDTIEKKVYVCQVPGVNESDGNLQKLKESVKTAREQNEKIRKLENSITQYDRRIGEQSDKIHVLQDENTKYQTTIADLKSQVGQYRQQRKNNDKKPTLYDAGDYKLEIAGKMAKVANAKGLWGIAEHLGVLGSGNISGFIRDVAAYNRIPFNDTMGVEQGRIMYRPDGIGPDIWSSKQLVDGTLRLSSEIIQKYNIKRSLA